MFKNTEGISIHSIPDKPPLFSLPDVYIDPVLEVGLTMAGFTAGYVGGFALTWKHLKNGNIQRLLRKL